MSQIPSSSDVAIRVENLGKQYRIGRAQERYDTLRDALTAGLRRPVDRLSSVVRGRSSDGRAYPCAQGGPSYHPRTVNSHNTESRTYNINDARAMAFLAARERAAAQQAFAAAAGM